MSGVPLLFCHKWGKVFKADSYIPLGIEGFLEIRNDSVWAIYSDESVNVHSFLYPESAPLNRRQRLI